MKSVKFKLISLMIGCFIFANDYTADNHNTASILIKAAIEPFKAKTFIDNLIKAGGNLNLIHKLDPLKNELNGAILSKNLPKIVDLVENHNANIDTTVLLLAIESNQTATVKYLIENFINKNKENSDIFDNAKILLNLAKMKGNKEVIKYINPIAKLI